MTWWQRAGLTAVLAAVPAVVLLLATRGPGVAFAKDSLRQTIRAPEFASPEAWLNTDKPLRMKDLRGQVVLLDFWTYCCINCMHVFPDLKYLEDKYKDEPFVVVGVHSGKFDQERDPENIRQAILRHNIAHPVAVDSDYQIWNAYGVRAWPTLVLIDPEGYVVTAMSGEGHREELDRAIGKVLDEHRRKGTLAKPMRFSLERDRFKPAALQFPGKVLADAKSGQLFISDTNHHRVLVADFDGKVDEVIGTGAIGLKDGSFNEAQFHQPQGLALSEDRMMLYVADTENHAVRAIDFAKRTVTTIAGTGKQSYDYRADGPGESTALSSPWALAREGEDLYIAMAGTHQIWHYDLKDGRVRVYAGTGREAGRDGPNRYAAFAQPSGLASDGRYLYIADSEISTIRAVQIARGARTTTVAGSGELFDFGHRDGRGREARFQHPLGVALHGDQLFVADAFNHLIRVIDLDTQQVRTFLGTGRPERQRGKDIGFFEPGGLSVAGDELFIADTNHHRIVRVKIPTREVKVVDVRIPEKLSAAPSPSEGG